VKTGLITTSRLETARAEGLVLFQHFINLSHLLMHLPTNVQSVALSEMLSVHIMQGVCLSACLSVTLQSTIKKKGEKGKEEYLYSSFLAKVVHSKRSGMDHTVLPANNIMPAITVA